MKLVLATALSVALAVVTAGASHQASAQDAVNPADFSPKITNPLFPLSLIGPKVFEGTETDDNGDEVTTRLESRLLPETTTVGGVTVSVLEEKAFVDGELVEVALDYFAQHRDGSVYYFGEAVDNYENGVLRDHKGAWRADEGQNRPGIIMPAQPRAGQTYDQEFAPGVAEDKATVLSLSETVVTPAGRYTGCMKTREFTPLEPDLEEFKWHCPNVGMAREEGDGSLSQLVSVAAAPAATPTAAPATPTAAAPRATATRPSGIVAPNTGGGGGSAPTTVLMLLALAALGASVTAGAMMFRGRSAG